VSDVQGEGYVLYIGVSGVQSEANVYSDVCLRYRVKEMFAVVCV